MRRQHRPGPHHPRQLLHLVRGGLPGTLPGRPYENGPPEAVAPWLRTLDHIDGYGNWQRTLLSCTGRPRFGELGSAPPLRGARRRPCSTLPLPLPICSSLAFSWYQIVRTVIMSCSHTNLCLRRPRGVEHFPPVLTTRCSGKNARQTPPLRLPSVIFCYPVAARGAVESGRAASRLYSPLLLPCVIPPVVRRLLWKNFLFLRREPDAASSTILVLDSPRPSPGCNRSSGDASLVREPRGERPAHGVSSYLAALTGVKP